MLELDDHNYFGVVEIFRKRLEVEGGLDETPKVLHGAAGYGDNFTTAQIYSPSSRITCEAVVVGQWPAVKKSLKSIV